MFVTNIWKFQLAQPISMRVVKPYWLIRLKPFKCSGQPSMGVTHWRCESRQRFLIYDCSSLDINNGRYYCIQDRFKPVNSKRTGTIIWPPFLKPNWRPPCGSWSLEWSFQFTWSSLPLTLFLERGWNSSVQQAYHRRTISWLHERKTCVDLYVHLSKINIKYCRSKLSFRRSVPA